MLASPQSQRHLGMETWKLFSRLSEAYILAGETDIKQQVIQLIEYHGSKYSRGEKGAHSRDERLAWENCTRERPCHQNSEGQREEGSLWVNSRW